MSERYNERERRETGRRRGVNPRIDAEGRRGGDDPLFDHEWHEHRERPLERGSRSGESPESTAESPGPRRASGSAGDRTRGLYGSRIGQNMVASAVAELIGTFILVFTGTAVATAAVLQRSTAGPAFYDSLAVALAFGIALTAIVASVGHVSGAHVNPAVTLGLAVTKKFPWQYVPLYLGAQLLGAALGAIGTWIAFGSPARQVADVAATYPVEGVGDIRAFLVELLITFILVFVVISVATDERAPAGAAPLAVGFALACGVLIAGPVTGGAVNPARALGPMIVAGKFTAAWVYIFGPLIGGVLAAVLYDRLVSEADATE
jgi:MIP family channel proteins